MAASPEQLPARVQSVGIGRTYTVSPTMLMDGNVGYTRLRSARENVDIGNNYGSMSWVFPALTDVFIWMAVIRISA